MGSRELSPSETAAALAARGYFPLPVVPGTKAVAVKDWGDLRIRGADVRSYFPPDADSSVGILLGVEVAPRCFLVALDVDIDDPDLISRCSLAFSSAPPAKKGAKGITYFVRVSEPIKKRYLTRKDPITGAKTNCIEVLAKGQQTVIPPSIHPNKMNYEWVGTPLYDIDPQDLPEMTAEVFKEIEVAVSKPASSLFFLNTMVSGGGDGSGTIHNSVLSAVAVLTALQWPDDLIWQRVSRATSHALSGIELPPRDYEPEKWEPTVRRMIADARTKGFDQTKPLKVHFIAARWLIDEWKGPSKVRVKEGLICSYDQGWWRSYQDSEIRHELATKFPEPPKANLTHDEWVKSTKTALDLVKPLPFLPPHRKVCLLNGTVDMDTGELLDWSPDDCLISQLSFEYDPEAVCPTYEAALTRAFKPKANGHDVDPDDLQRSIDCFEEFVAHTLFECLDFHRFLVLKGQPRTGKSTLIRVAEMLLGEHAVSAVPVQEFGNEYYRAAMVNKLLNVVNEVAAMSHAADDFLKSVTAGDRVSARFPYREPLMVRLQTRIIIGCNELFRVRDTSGAIEERMLILVCDNRLEEDERDVRMADKLQGELPGIFNRMIVAWRRLRDRGQFLPPGVSRDAVSDFTSENNVVLAWLKECTWQGAALEGSTPPEELPPTETGVLYFSHSEWAKMNGHKQMSKITFGMKLSEIRIPGLDLNPKVTKVGPRSIRVRQLTLMDKAKF